MIFGGYLPEKVSINRYSDCKAWLRQPVSPAIYLLCTHALSCATCRQCRQMSLSLSPCRQMSPGFRRPPPISLVFWGCPLFGAACEVSESRAQDTVGAFTSIQTICNVSNRRRSQSIQTSQIGAVRRFTEERNGDCFVCQGASVRGGGCIRCRRVVPEHFPHVVTCFRLSSKRTHNRDTCGPATCGE